MITNLEVDSRLRLKEIKERDEELKLNMKNLFCIIVVLLLFCFCGEKNKNRESIINSLAYPITIEEVIKKIGEPDSITFENYDAGSFGVSINKIYHYGTYQLIFSPHGVYLGKKEIKSEIRNK